MRAQIRYGGQAASVAEDGDAFSVRRCNDDALVFIDRRPNAVMLACANYIALAAVIISAITNSYSQLGQGLVGVAVYGLMGVVLQGIAILSMHFVIPGDFHEHIDEPDLHPAAFATAVMLLAVGGVTAAAVS